MRIVIVMCASPDSVREVMIMAHKLNFDNGEYVFINVDLFGRSAPALLFEPVDPLYLFSFIHHNSRSRSTTAQ